MTTARAPEVPVVKGQFIEVVLETPQPNGPPARAYVRARVRKAFIAEDGNTRVVLRGTARRCTNKDFVAFAAELLS